MKKIIIFGIVIVLLSSFVLASQEDDFEDGDFTNDPTWTELDPSGVGTATVQAVTVKTGSDAVRLQLTGVAGDWLTLNSSFDFADMYDGIKFSTWVRTDDVTNNDAARIYIYDDAAADVAILRIRSSQAARYCSGVAGASNLGAVVNDAWYRFEITYHSASIDFRVYDSSNALLYSDLAVNCLAAYDDIENVLIGSVGVVGGYNAYFDNTTWTPDNSTAPPITLFELTASNYYNTTALNNFTANFTNGTGTTSITTNNGSIYYPDDQVVDILVYDVENETYFNRSYSNYNTSSNLDSEHWQSILILDAKEKITNNLISSFNITVGTQFNTSNSSNLTTFYLNADTYNATGISAAYYNGTGTFTTSTLETQTGTLYFASNELNITAIDYFDNSTITDFTVQVNYNDSYFENLSTTTGWVHFYGIAGTYDLTIYPGEYSAVNEQVNLSNTSQNHTFVLFEKNSIYIHIYDQETGELVTENISIEFITNDLIFTNYTVSGGFFIANLTPNNYTLSFDSANYTKISYDVIVVSGSNQTLNAYLSSFTDQVKFLVSDANSKENVLEDVSIAVTRIVGSSWEQVMVLSTDITGRAAFYYETDEKYCFVISKAGYQTQSFCLNPIIFTEYEIYLTPDVSASLTYDYGGINILFNPWYYENNNNHNITFQFISPTGIFESYSYTITYKSTVLTDSGVNANGELFDTNLSISGASWGDQVFVEFTYKTTLGIEKTFKYNFFIANTGGANNTFISNKGKDYGMGVYERTLVSTAIVMFAAGGVTFFAGSLPGGLVAFIIFGYLMYIEFMPFWAGVISMIFLFIIVGWRASQ